MGLFNKTAAKKTETKAPKSKGTAWTIPDSEQASALEKAIDETVRLQGEIKARETQQNLHKGILKRAMEALFLRDSAQLGVFPETPMTLASKNGSKVTFVVQDRSSQYGVTDEQLEELSDVLGPDAANSLLYEQTTYHFNPTVLAIPGVQEAIEKTLEKTIGKLVEAGTIAPEHAEVILDADTKRALKPGTIDRLAEVCGRDTTKMAKFLAAVGSACVRYVKA